MTTTVNQRNGDPFERQYRAARRNRISTWAAAGLLATVVAGGGAVAALRSSNLGRNVVNTYVPGTAAGFSHDKTEPVVIDGYQNPGISTVAQAVHKVDPNLYLYGATGQAVQGWVGNQTPTHNANNVQPGETLQIPVIPNEQDRK